jgi:hypothetical protein
MKTQVTVSAPKGEQEVFIPNKKLGKNGEAFGYIRVVQSKVDFSGNFVAVKEVSALKPLRTTDWEKIKGFIKLGDKLDGQIVITESLTPFYEGQELDGFKKAPRSTKDANGLVKQLTEADGVTIKMRPVTHNGSKIYVENKFTEDMSLTDTLLTYDKYVEEEQPVLEAKGTGKKLA